eukprot:30552-Alexandrium_andersonii.AAC.1
MPVRPPRQPKKLGPQTCVKELRHRRHEHACQSRCCSIRADRPAQADISHRALAQQRAASAYFNTNPVGEAVHTRRWKQEHASLPLRQVEGAVVRPRSIPNRNRPLQSEHVLNIEAVTVQR